MFDNKFVKIFLCWVAVVIAYLFIALFMPAGRELVSTASTELDASANMTNFPGTSEFVGSSPVWIWILPGLIGFIYTAYMLKKQETPGM